MKVTEDRGESGGTGESVKEQRREQGDRGEIEGSGESEREGE